MTSAKTNQSLCGKERVDVEAAYPDLHFHIENGRITLRGTFRIVFEGEVLDRYAIEIEIPPSYPRSIPIVREIGGRIPHASDFHVNPTDGTCCVILPDERWKVWPIGSSLLAFLNGPVRNFFLGQSLVELGGPWPFGQWGHGAGGIREYYSDLLGTSDVKVILRYLDCMGKKKMKGHWSCPCGSGKRLRECHWEFVQDLMTKIPRRVAMDSLNKVREMR